MDSQRGLSHPRLSDRSRDHQCRRPVFAGPHAGVQPLQSQFAPGEVRNIRRQLARHGPLRSRRTRVLIGAFGQTSASVAERFAIGVIQSQCISKQSDCCAARMLNLAAFEISDCPHTHARPTGELVL
jgi:hypothetical protein